MKNHLLVIGVIILAVIVAGLVVFLVFFSNKQQAPTPVTGNPFSDAVETGTANMVTSPADFSVNFYKWYIANTEASSSFPTTEQLQNSFTQWMTPDFILQYQSTISDPNNDADPILFAQDDPRGWGSGITGTLLSQTDSSASVEVVIGSGSKAHTFKVQLVKSSGQWLIDSISGTY